MMKTVNLPHAFVVTMTVTASLASASSETNQTAVMPGFTHTASTQSTLLPTVRLRPATTEVHTGRPTSSRRKALLETQAGQAMQQRALRDLGDALDHHGLAPLVALRLRQGLTQKALCDASGLPQPHLSRLENGKVANPDSATLGRLAEALGVTMDEVMEAIQQGATA